MTERVRFFNLQSGARRHTDDKGGMEKYRSKREMRFAVASYRNQKKPTWPVDSALPGSESIVSMMREARISPLPSPWFQGTRSRAYAFSAGNPLIAPNVAVFEEIVLLLADRVRRRRRRPVRAVGQQRNPVAQLFVLRFQSGDSFFQGNHFFTIAGAARLVTRLALPRCGGLSLHDFVFLLFRLFHCRLLL